MVNIVFNKAALLGIFLYLAGVTLCCLPLYRPEVARYHDILFAEMYLVCSLILVFQGWRLDPILELGNLLLIGSSIFSIVQTIRLRGMR